MRVFGLQSAAASMYNDTEGVVIQFKEDTLRWDVVMDYDGSLKSLAAENLECLHHHDQGTETNFHTLAEMLGVKNNTDIEEIRETRASHQKEEQGQTTV